MADTIYQTIQNEMLDKIVYNHYGSVSNGELEVVLKKNPDIPKLGSYLPMGTQVILPEIHIMEKSNKVSLWD